MARPWKFWKHDRSAKLSAPNAPAPAYRILASGERVLIEPRAPLANTHQPNKRATA